jgi:hypothetical protein
VEDGSLALEFPDGATYEAEVVLGERIETGFYGRPVTGRIVEGPWNEALSELAGRPIRIARTEHQGDGHDRGRRAGASLVSTGALEALQAAAGSTAPVDGRRFRMTIGVEGIEPHGEDTWIGSRVRVGGAVVVVCDKVGRCAATTLDPDSGTRDLDTLGALASYRRDVPTREPLPFGVWGDVVEPGRVVVGDPIDVAS